MSKPTHTFKVTCLLNDDKISISTDFWACMIDRSTGIYHQTKLATVYELITLSKSRLNKVLQKIVRLTIEYFKNKTHDSFGLEVEYYRSRSLNNIIIRHDLDYFRNVIKTIKTQLNEDNSDIWIGVLDNLYDHDSGQYIKVTNIISVHYDISSEQITNAIPYCSVTVQHSFASPGMTGQCKSNLNEFRVFLVSQRSIAWLQNK